jgi:aminoglycoside phosphotransferase (APT) family kinase protein
MSSAPVYSREEFVARVCAYLGRQLVDAKDLRLEGIEQMAVGWSHETWLFDALFEKDGESQTLGLCLRRDPGNALLRHFSDLKEQFRVLTCLEGTELAAPKVYWYEDDPEILGAPFLVMEKVPGTCPSPWGSSGQRFYAEAAERGVLPESFTGTLATLHNVDWKAAGLDFLGVPKPGAGFALREVKKWRGLIEASQMEPDPILVDLLGWLEANAPAPARLTLVHGAYRTGNLLIHDDRISAVLDWELQTIGDPMYDVAYVLADLNREGSDLLSHLVTRDAFFRQYEEQTGFEIDEDVCRYYRMLYLMRGAAFWMSAAGLYATGQSRDIRLARTYWSVPVVLDNAARELGY